MVIPIWKDTLYTAVTGFEYAVAVVNNAVAVDGETIAEGVLTPYPDGIARLPINRIAENFLISDINFDEGIHQHPLALRTFQLKSGNEVIATYDFILDWSYSPIPDGNYVLSNPINGKADSRMKLLYSTYNKTPRNICYD